MNWQKHKNPAKDFAGSKPLCDGSNTRCAAAAWFDGLTMTARSLS